MRRARIVTVAQQYQGGPEPENNRDLMRQLVKRAGAEKPDLICLPETFLGVNVSERPLAQVAESVPGPTTDMAAAEAKRLGCYVICPLIVRRGDAYMNESVLIDRQGQIIGSYAKIHPVVSGAQYREMESGVTPGDTPAVFDTDLGQIGMLICFDINWPQEWCELKNRGAEIVFWSSAYDGGKHLSIYAWLHHYYVVSAVQSQYARIINPMGQVIAATGRHHSIIAETIDLGLGIFHLDFNKSALNEIQNKYGPDVTLDIWDQEAMFTMVCNRPDLHVADLIDEFALERLDDYIARNTQLQDAWREGRPIPDLTPPYLGRVQYP